MLGIEPVSFCPEKMGDGIFRLFCNGSTRDASAAPLLESFPDANGLVGLHAISDAQFRVHKPDGLH